VAREEVELSVRVEAALALVDALHRTEPPGAEQRRDPGGPRPLAHAVEALALAHVVAIGELVVREQVPVGVHDPLRKPGRAARVVELRGIVAGGVERRALRRLSVEQPVVEHEHALMHPLEARCVRAVGHDDPRARVLEPVPNPVVAVEHAHRQQRRAQLPGAEEDRRRLRGGRQHDRDAVDALHARRRERVRGLRGEVLQLSPRHVAPLAVKALVDHRQSLARVLVADVGGDVVARRDLPAVLGDRLLV
jgi:hypothetical protein